MPSLRAFNIDIAVEDLELFCEFLSKDFKKDVSVKEIFGQEFVVKKQPTKVKKIKIKEDVDYEVENSSDGKKYRCKLCDTVCHSSRGLTQHIKGKHSTEHKTIKCDKCDYSTTTELRLSNHMLSQHSDKISKQKPCEICGKILAHKKALSKHIREVHTKAEVYHCDLCSYSTKRNYDLTKHVAEKHSGKSVPSFACYVCGHCTKTKQSLQDHIDKNHNNVDFPCDQCDFIGKSKRHLSDHKRDHWGIPPCPVCSKEFKTRKAADKHVRESHRTVEKVTLHCEFCSYSTESKKILQRHTFKTHGVGDLPEVKKTGKIYRCPLPGCGKEYDTNTSKVQHIWKTHKMRMGDAAQFM